MSLEEKLRSMARELDDIQASIDIQATSTPKDQGVRPKQTNGVDSGFYPKLSFPEYDLLEGESPPAPQNC